jgi:hypothetical protein
MPVVTAENLSASEKLRKKLDGLDTSLISDEKLLKLIVPVMRQIYIIIMSIKASDETQDFRDELFDSVSLDEVITEITHLHNNIFPLMGLFSYIDIESELLVLYCENYVSGLVKNIELSINNKNTKN